MNSPRMYLLRMTLHWTGVFTKSWLMVARAGSTTNGMRKRNNENVERPRSHRIIFVEFKIGGVLPTDAAVKVT